ncbi:MAG: MFS transporter [Clostridia bacterium]|nr:MFS transporter [Clostridia bacterium]
MLALVAGDRPIGKMGEREDADLSDRKLNRSFGILQSFFLSANCAYFSFLVVYLSAMGYTEARIGLVMTLVSTVSVITPSILGYMADYVIPIKQIVLFMLLISIPLGFSLIFTVQILPLALVSIVLLGISERSMINVVDSWGMKIRLTHPGLNYGLTRGIASMAFALAALLLGRFYAARGIQMMFWVHALFLIVAVGAGFFLANVPTVGRKQDGHSYFQTIWLLLHDRTYVILLICMCLHGLSTVTVHTFRPMLIESMGGTSAHVGAALFIQAGSEAPVMLASAWFIRKFKVERLLILSFLFAALRLLATVIAPSLGWVIGVQVLQSIAYGLYLPVVLFYISLITRPEMRATAITLATSVGFGLSGILGNSLGGLLAQARGVRSVYFLFSALIFLAFILFLINTRLRREPV